MKGLKDSRGVDDFSRNYERDRLSDWAIDALERPVVLNTPRNRQG